MFLYLERNKVGIGVLLAIIPVIWGITTYLIEAKQKERASNFVNYHKVIQDIFKNEEGGPSEQASAQRALIFELGQFENYKVFTCREIPKLKNQFNNEATLAEFDILFEQLKCK